ncbi:hypothetical protein M011DRAFT_472343 [Sporormia fimetaria CBS 119925]|uniref:Secreted protein n=1 Tax=Sporormia fimetaria CBS 119925 TaxID=1340428 RepID=A0A6A6UX64_9PLEO|nr:hypothetical protein M011DRAFT_472343 [Sporormia fimetaria CBS 119925]
MACSLHQASSLLLQLWLLSTSSHRPVAFHFHHHLPSDFGHRYTSSHRIVAQSRPPEPVRGGMGSTGRKTERGGVVSHGLDPAPFWTGECKFRLG